MKRSKIASNMSVLNMGSTAVLYSYDTPVAGMTTRVHLRRLNGTHLPRHDTSTSTPQVMKRE